jgi:hypothetical protein
LERRILNNEAEVGYINKYDKLVLLLEKCQKALITPDLGEGKGNDYKT